MISVPYRSLSRDAEQIAALVCHYSREFRESRLLAMLSAYIDDSGNSELPVLVFAGFCSTPARWEVFSDEWRTVLNMHPRLPYFKASEAFGLSGNFHGWNPAIRDERVTLLAEVIKRHSVYGVVVEAPYALLGEYFRGPRGGYFDVTHMMAFAMLLACIGGASRKHANGEKTDLILDKSLFKGLTREFMNKAWDSFDPMFHAGISWPPQEKDDMDVLPLQAADMIAWPFRQRVVDFLKKKETIPIAVKAVESLNPLPIFHKQIGLADLKEWSFNAQQGNDKIYSKALIRLVKKPQKPPRTKKA